MTTQLPALNIVIQGGVQVSNLDEFKAVALGSIESINLDLHTDQDFADAEADIRWCAEVEARIKDAKDRVVSQSASIDELYRTMDLISAEARDKRLGLKRTVDARKDAIRGSLLLTTADKLRNHLKDLDASLGKRLMPVINADFQNAIKGKRSLDSMQQALEQELQRAIQEADSTAANIRENLRLIDEAGMPSLFADLGGLVLKTPEFVAVLIENRISKFKADQQAKADAERKEAERREAERANAEAIRVEAEVRVAAEAAIAKERAASLAEVAVQKRDSLDQFIDDVQATLDEMHPPAPIVINESHTAAPEVINLAGIRLLLSPLSIDEEGLTELGFWPVGRAINNLPTYQRKAVPQILKAIADHINETINNTK